MKNSLAWMNAISAVIAAKWAMELGFNQFRQLLWGIAGLFAGPLVLLILYVRMLYRQQDERRQKQEMSRSMAGDL